MGYPLVLFIGPHTEPETEESDPALALDLCLIHAREIWVIRESPTMTYTPSCEGLQLGMFGVLFISLPLGKCNQRGGVRGNEEAVEYLKVMVRKARGPTTSGGGEGTYLYV